MLTPPLGVLQQFWNMFSIGFIPVPQGNWYTLATKAQADQVLALAQKNNPGAKLQLVSGTLSGNTAFILLPEPNPLNMDVWLIQGTAPTASGGTLTVNDYAGDVWDRGPLDQGFGGSPDPLDTNGAYGGVGGENLTLGDDGSGIAIFRWSKDPQGAIV